jgi:hypothetical protein
MQESAAKRAFTPRGQAEKRMIKQRALRAQEYTETGGKDNTR